jgi:hypothetical protein
MKKIAILVLASMFLATSTFAGGMTVGVSGGLIQVSADGKETTTAGSIAGGGANTNTASADNHGMIPSVFAEYNSDYMGLTLGFELIPGSADVSEQAKTRSESAQGVSGTDSTGTVTRKAQAEIENVRTIYVEMPIGSEGLFVKAGWTMFDLNTLETSPTSGGTYGNSTDVDGYVVGAGIKKDYSPYIVKFGVEIADYEEINLTSTTSNKITADLDTVQAKLSVGYSF